MDQEAIVFIHWRKQKYSENSNGFIFDFKCKLVLFDSRFLWNYFALIERYVVEIVANYLTINGI